MEWLSVSTRILLFSSFLVVTSLGDFSTGAIQAIRCMLLQTTVPTCTTIPEVPVPSYLIKAFNESPTPLHEALRTGQLAQLTDAQVASLPLSLIYLIPRGRLSDLSGAGLGAILQKYADDTSVAHQLTASVQKQRQLVDLILKLKLSTLSQDTLQILGDTINVADLNPILNSLHLEEPLLVAYLRPSVMLHVNDKTGYDVLLRLQGNQPPKLPKKDTIYLIAQMAIKNRFPLTNINWLVLGLSPDEIKNDSLQLDLNYQHLKLDLTSAQARAVFEQLYQNMVLNKSNLIDYLPLLHKLTPSMLQRLPPTEYNYDSLLKIPIPQSLATACQIQEYIKDDCQWKGKLPKEDFEPWGFRIRYLEQWVFTLPLTSLEEYLDTPLNTAHFLQIQSPALSALQTYYLTGRGESFDIKASSSLMVSDTFLRALPASQLIGHSTGEIPSRTVRYLATNLPADNLPRTLAFVYRNPTISEWFLLEHLLVNRDVNSIMSLISPKHLKEAAPRMLKCFKDKHQFAPLIRQLPQQILAALLDQAQQSDWSWQNLLDKSHVSRLLVGGLTCHHIEQMEDGLFVPIMAVYNRHRKQAFPRNLQICSLQKLISYLKFKMAVTQTDPNLGLISILEPVEIESVGGYLLVGLPVSALRASPYLGHIFAKIGKLSNAELILAANMTHLQSVAQLVVDKKENADVYVVRNLVWFLPPNTTILHFKLMLQSGLLDTTLCLPQELRRLLAINLMAAFGPPEAWSAGVLATLQDLLLVFTDEELRNVSKAAWTEAADMFTSHYGDNVNWIKPTPFHQVCASFLEESEEAEYESAVRRLVRWQLLAAQWLLDTVHLPPNSSGSKATTIIIPVDYDDMDESERTSVEVFSPQLSEEEDSSSSSETSTTNSETAEQPTSYAAETTPTGENLSTTQRSTTVVTERVDEENNSIDVLEDNNNNTTVEESTESSVEVITSSAVNTDEHKPAPEAPVYGRNNASVESAPDVHPYSIFNDTVIHIPSLNWEHTPTDDKTSDENGSYSNGGSEEESFGNVEPEMSVNRLNETASKRKEQNESINTKVPSLLPSTPSPTNINTPLNFSESTISNKTVNSTDANSHKNKTRIESTFNETNKNVSNSHINLLPQATGLTNEVQNENKSSTFQSQETSNQTTDTKYSITSNGSIDFNAVEIFHEEFDGEKSIIKKTRSYPETAVRSRRSIVPSESVIQLSCNALRMVGRLSGIALTEKDLQSMRDLEVQECRVELGAMDLSTHIRKGLWKRIGKKKKEGIHLLGSLLQAATVGDIWDMNTWDVSQPWVLETIYAFIRNVNESTVLKKLLLEVHKSNSDFPPELSAVLGGSLCFLESDILSNLQPPVIGLQPLAICPPCLPLLAQRAIQQLGPVTEWTPHYVHSLNDIVAGLQLQDWKELTESTLKPLSALQPSAIACLNNSHLEILAPEHIQVIPTLTLHALLPQQIAALNASQIQALRSATQVTVEDKLTPTKTILVAGVPSSGSYHVASILLVLTSLFYIGS